MLSSCNPSLSVSSACGRCAWAAVGHDGTGMSSSAIVRPRTQADSRGLRECVIECARVAVVTMSLSDSATAS